MESRYKQGKIYKIVCNETGKCYIGSTCEPKLARRLAQHRGDYTKFLNAKKGRLSAYEILENKNYSIVLVEDYPCERREQLLQRERFHIENTECVNKIRPIVSECERKEQIKEWFNVNKDYIIEKQKEYYNTNKEEILDKNKEYRQANKEEIQKQKQEYYKENKNYFQEKFNCECGGKYIRQHQVRHLKSLKHLNYCKTI